MRDCVRSPVAIASAPAGGCAEPWSAIAPRHVAGHRGASACADHGRRGGRAVTLHLDISDLPGPAGSYFDRGAHGGGHLGRHADQVSCVGNAITAPPTCVFQGVLHVAPDQTALALSHSTPSPVCWMLDRYVLGRLFSDRDHANTLLPSFHFDVLGMKVVDGRSYYLLYGRALAPGADPQSMIGWVDYDRGLITDGTIQYAWGQVNLTQDYGLVDGIWVLVHQYIVVPRFSASLEISCTADFNSYHTNREEVQAAGFAALRNRAALQSRAAPSGIPARSPVAARGDGSLTTDLRCCRPSQPPRSGWRT